MVQPKDTPVTPEEPEPVSIVVESQVEVQQDSNEEPTQVEAFEQTGQSEQILVHEDEPSVLAVVWGELLEGSAGEEGTQEITI